MKSMMDGISVIVCCYNSSEKIGNVLHHIEKQSNTEGISWEVIVVDNASDDNTAEVAQNSWSRDDVRLKVVFEGEPGLSHARRKGLQISAYSIVIFVDDDNLISEDYISKAYGIMTENRDVGLAGGLGFPVSSAECPAWFEDHQRAFAVGPQSDGNGYVPETRSYLHGAGLIMRKSVWEDMISKGFNLILSGRKGKALSSGEDSEISAIFKIAGYRMWYDSGLTFEHLIPASRMTWEYVIKLSREFGKSFVILEIYRSIYQELTGWRKTKAQNWLVGNTFTLLNLVRLFPVYLWLKIAGKIGNHTEFRFNFQYGALLQRMRLAFRYAGIKKEIIAISGSLARV